MRWKRVLFALLLCGVADGCVQAQTVSSGSMQYVGAWQTTSVIVSLPIAWSGASGPNNAWIWASNPSQGLSPPSNPISGQCTDTYSCVPYFFGVGRDTVDASAAVNGFVAFNVIDNFGGTGAKGGHHAALFQFNMVASPSDSGQTYTALNSYATASANAGGTSGSPAGELFAGNDSVGISSGATYWNQIVGREIDVYAATGSSVRDKIGLQIVQASLDAVFGTGANIGFSLNNAPGTPGWGCGACFGSFSGYNPMNSGGTLIGTFNHAGSVGGGAMGTVANGVDFRQYTFTGQAYASNGFAVDGSGNITGASYKVASTAGASCSGTPSSSFAAAGGIITHC